jgi:hypothetical protein
MGLLWGAVQGDKDDDQKKLLITGSMPATESTKGERGLQERAYGGNYMLRVGGRNGWSFNYSRFEPFGTVLGTLADGIRALKQPSPAPDKLDALYGYFVAQAQSKTFLQGVAQFVQTLQESKNIGDAAKKAVMQAIVPNIIRQPLRSLDEYVRDSHGGGLKYQALPSAENAPKAVNPYGHDIEKTGGPISRLLFPTGIKPDEQLSRADRLLLRWNQENPSAKWGPSTPDRKVKLNGKEVDMPPDQYERFLRVAGRMASDNLSGRISERQIENPKPDDVKLIKEAFERAHREAKAQVEERLKVRHAFN